MKNFSPTEIREAAQLLKNGQLIAFPTETVYGLGAPIFNEEALRDIYLAKGRPADNPLIVHISSLQQLPDIAIDIPPAFYLLAARFFPGPLTIILRKHPRVPSIVSAGLETIAIRMPAHPIAKQLIEAVGEPLAAPSANLSGRPSATEAAHVIADFGATIGGVIDGGPTTLGLESTVLSLDPLVLLRPGSITKKDLEETLGLSIREKTSTDALTSPGMKYRHYAPQARLRLLTEEEPIPPAALVLARHNRGYAQFLPLRAETLYASLRTADELHYLEVVVICDAETLSNAALMNRLFHAAAG